MDGCAAGVPGGFYDGIDVEIALGRQWATDYPHLVHRARMVRLTLDAGAHADGPDPKAFRGAGDSCGNLAAVGYEQSFEHGVGTRDEPYMRKTPNRVSSIGRFSAADMPSASAVRVSAGSRIPSSQRLLPIRD